MTRLTPFLALLLLSLPAFADPLSTCLRASKGVTTEINSCLGAECSRQDARLETAYETALAKLEGDSELRLRDSQQKWTQYRDTSCGFIGNIIGGTEDSPRHLECLIRETTHRANELKSLPL